MSTEPKSAFPGVPFVNEVRLNWKHWCIVLTLVVSAVLAIPRLWKRLERFEVGQDYRIPYSLSRDYWLYERRLEQIPEPDAIFLLGDSVVWGEYVLPDGTLARFLNGETKQPGRFINAGINGLFPLAMEGLIGHYAESIRGRKVILHCNLLWMSSPKADLQIQKEERFNHSRLVPQFTPRIPCYKADANERLSVVVERNVQFMSWVSHLQSAYFDDKSIPKWTLQEDLNDPPGYPNAARNPLRQIRMRVPSAPLEDPQRGPASPRHKSWAANGARQTQFDWVTIESSLQWSAFKRVVQKLKARGNDVLVVVGPFNEHLVTKENLGGFQRLRDGAVSWMKGEGILVLVPEVLPSALYADASHPLTQGYEMLAKSMAADPNFQKWLHPRTGN